MDFKFKQKRIILILLLLLFVAGCGPTYPKETILQSVQQLCKKEYDVDVKTKLAGKTLGVYMQVEELFDKEMNPTPQAFEKMSDVMFATTRVVLSSDADIDFCVLIVADKNFEDFEWIITRYVPDTKHIFVSIISREEYFRRTDMDLRFNIKKELGVSPDDFILEDVNMGDFLAKQIARKIKEQFTTKPGLLQKFEITDATGIYQKQLPEEGPQFIFTVGITQRPGSEEELENPEALAQNIVLKIVAGTLSDYKFYDFEFVRIENLATQKFITVGEASLWKYAKIKIKY